MGLFFDGVVAGIGITCLTFLSLGAYKIFVSKKGFENGSGEKEKRA